MSSADKPAFPCLQSPGMTLRQWYAGQALAGVMANPVFLKETIAIARNDRVTKEILIAAICQTLADAMIAALKDADDAW